MTPTDRPSKQEAFLTFLKDGWVTVYVDARRPGVSVPPHLKDEARLVLQYGLNMPVPVDDLEVTEAGIKATLSFSRQPHSTLIPWTAVYVIACTDGRGVLYQEDVPAELMAAAAEAEVEESGPRGDPGASGSPGAGETAPPGGRLASVPATGAETDLAPEATKPARARLQSVPMPEEPAHAEGQPGSSSAEDARGSVEASGDPKAEDRTPPPDKPRGRPTLHLVK